MKTVICNIPKKGEHCLKQCAHGRPHPKETGHDACHIKTEFCNCHGGPKLAKVICIEVPK